MDKIITAKSYTLRTESGQWLGQIVLTSDGMIAGVTDYGNLSYAWRSYGENFEDFILSINTGYFASKLESGMAYIAHNKTIQKGCERFAEMILPALQAEIKKQRLEDKPESPDLLLLLTQSNGMLNSLLFMLGDQMGITTKFGVLTQVGENEIAINKATV